MKERTVTVRNRAGIHARPAALIVQTAGKFDSNIVFKKDGEEINAKSIMGIITLGASYNSQIVVAADGADEDQALEELFHLFENRFEEE